MTDERNLKTEWHRILVTGVSGPCRKLIEKKSRIRWVENSTQNSLAHIITRGVIPKFKAKHKIA